MDWRRALPEYFVYGSDIPVTPWIAGCRAERVGAVLPPFLQNFPAIWDERRNEIVKGLRYLETYDLSGKSPAEIWQFMTDARAFHVRAWEIHFDLMYPLTANYLGFYGLCKELGIAAADIPKFLQGYETQPMKSDRAMWQLANAARGTQVHKLIADTPAAASTRRSRAAGGRGVGEGIRRLSYRSTAGAATASSMSVRRPGSRTRTDASASSGRFCKATIPMRFEHSLKSAVSRARRADRAIARQDDDAGARRVRSGAGVVPARQFCLVERRS